MPDKIRKFISKWMIEYIKNKDLVKKSITNISIEKNYNFIVEFNDKKQFFIIEPIIKDINKIIRMINPVEQISIVLLNNLHNFDLIVKNWKSFIDFKLFSIYFVNPFSELEKKWIIFPHSHHKISDEKSLKKGLKSLFQSVEQISKDKINEKLNLQDDKTK
jgi:hypothetical protein